eukprot:4984610-Pleurochrysis_carterae.AAC.1
MHVLSDISTHQKYHQRAFSDFRCEEPAVLLWPLIAHCKFAIPEPHKTTYKVHQLVSLAAHHRNSFLGIDIRVPGNKKPKRSNKQVCSAPEYSSIGHLLMVFDGRGSSLAVEVPWPWKLFGRGSSLAVEVPWPWTVEIPWRWKLEGVAEAVEIPWPCKLECVANRRSCVAEGVA